MDVNSQTFAANLSDSDGEDKAELMRVPVRPYERVLRRASGPDAVLM